jgi:3-deoxy-D-manno-octulosonic-acid transferase/heptosyltransferase-1
MTLRRRDFALKSVLPSLRFARVNAASAQSVAEPCSSCLIFSALNILIVKLSAIGDVIHTMPALVALRRHYPQAHISWLVEEAGAELLQGHTALDRLIIWRRGEFQSDCRRLRWARAARTLGSVLGQVRDRRYDLVIDFQALMKSGMWVFAARGKRKVGFGPGMEHSEGSYVFLNERVPALSMEVHALDRGLALLEQIGVPRASIEYQVPHDAEADAAVASFLSENGISADADLVLIHPMARWRTKLWTSRGFADLADALQADGLHVVFSGGHGDASAIDAIAALMKSRCRRFDGRGGLRDLAALCRRARVVVSTDTGPMHLAAAVGTPVVALFGPTAPNRTGPYGHQHEVIQSGVQCSPCFKRRCRSQVVEEFGCMKRIEVDQVHEAVTRKLSRRVQSAFGIAQD